MSRLRIRMPLTGVQESQTTKCPSWVSLYWRRLACHEDTPQKRLQIRMPFLRLRERQTTKCPSRVWAVTLDSWPPEFLRKARSYSARGKKDSTVATIGATKSNRSYGHLCSSFPWVRISLGHICRTELRPF